jgi:hypothetical protein
MTTRRGTRKSIRRSDLARLWILGTSFDPQRTQIAEGDVKVLLDNPVAVSLRPSSSHRDALEAIARSAQLPFEIGFLQELLKDRRFPRGNTYSGYVGEIIGQIVSNHDEQGLRWCDPPRKTEPQEAGNFGL